MSDSIETTDRTNTRWRTRVPASNPSCGEAVGADMSIALCEALGLDPRTHVKDFAIIGEEMDLVRIKLRIQPRELLMKYDHLDSTSHPCEVLEILTPKGFVARFGEALTRRAADVALVRGSAELSEYLKQPVSADDRIRGEPPATEVRKVTGRAAEMVYRGDWQVDPVPRHVVHQKAAAVQASMFQTLLEARDKREQWSPENAAAKLFQAFQGQFAEFLESPILTTTTP